MYGCHETAPSLPRDSGLDVAQIVSHVKHFSEFVCGLCDRLVSLDSVVATCCSHPYCRKCMERWVTDCSDERRLCECPGCRAELLSYDETHDSDDSSMLLGAARVIVRPLHESQPLAYRILCQVQVSCPRHSPLEECPWVGDYEKYLSHAISHTTAVRSHLHHSPSRSPSKQKNNRDRTFIADSVHDKNQSLTSSSHHNQPSVHQHSNESIEARYPNVEKELHWKNDLSTSLLVWNNDNQSGHPASSLDGSGNSGSNRLPLALSLQSPRRSTTCTVSPTRPTLSKSPVTTKNFAKRTYSHEVVPPFDMLACNSNDSKSSLLDVVEGDHSDEVDDQTNSRGGLDAASNDDSLQRGIFLQADKLKKQANAKFNKGDLSEAQKLYTEGINVMEKLDPSTNDDFKLLSNMHSNRAATFYREKRFNECIKDCEHAIEYEPTLEKAWIRKKRALSVSGDFDEAHCFLRSALRELPDSPKIQDEFKRSKAEMETFTKAKGLTEKSQSRHSWQILKTIVDKCETTAMLIFAANVAIEVDESSKALEIINKVLVMNPNSVDGLELRGLWPFLSGDTEQAIQLLTDACKIHKSNTQLEAALIRVQRTHEAYEEARLAVKNGQYQDAIERFTQAIQSSSSISPSSPLYAVLRTGRSESYLLSHQYVHALKECQEVLSVRREYAPAWIIRSEVLIALGKVDDAKQELTVARRTWGADNPTIQEGLKRVDFEQRMHYVDVDISAFQDDLDKGNRERLRHIQANKVGDRSPNHQGVEVSPRKLKHKSGSVRHLNPPKERPLVSQRSFRMPEPRNGLSDNPVKILGQTDENLGVKPPRQRANRGDESPGKRNDDNRRNKQEKTTSNKERSSSITRSRNSTILLDGDSKPFRSTEQKCHTDDDVAHLADRKRKDDDPPSERGQTSRDRNALISGDGNAKVLKKLEKRNRGDESFASREDTRKVGGSSLPEEESPRGIDRKLPRSVDGDIKPQGRAEKSPPLRPSPLKNDHSLKQRRASLSNDGVLQNINEGVSRSRDDGQHTESRHDARIARSKLERMK